MSGAKENQSDGMRTVLLKCDSMTVTGEVDSLCVFPVTLIGGDGHFLLEDTDLELGKAGLPLYCAQPGNLHNPLQMVYGSEYSNHHWGEGWEAGSEVRQWEGTKRAPTMAGSKWKETNSWGKGLCEPMQDTNLNKDVRSKRKPKRWDEDCPFEM